MTKKQRFDVYLKLLPTTWLLRHNNTFLNAVGVENVMSK